MDPLQSRTLYSPSVKPAARGFHGPDAEAFEARLTGIQWAIGEIKTGDDAETLKALRNQGLSIREIAERTGLGKTTVARR